MKKLFAITLVFICSIFQLSAQERLTEKVGSGFVSRSDTLNIYFNQASSKWDPQLYNNQASLQKFLNLYRKLREYSGLYRITDIQIIAGCSPEGLYDYNLILSRNRVKCIRNVIETYSDLPDSLVTEKAIGIDWDGLRKMAENDPDLPLKNEALDIIDNSPELYVNEFGKRMELRKVRLMWRYDGRIWKYMYEHYFPYLRCFNLSLIIKWEKIADVDDKDFLVDFADINPIEHKLAYNKADYLKVPEFIEPYPEGKFYCSIRSNLLYDLLAVPNIGMEFYLGKGVSLNTNWSYAWWKSDPVNWYWRTYGGEIGLRYWFGKAASKKPLTGHHIGVLGQVLTYDFELGKMGIMGGKPGGVLLDQPNYAVALEYGYSLPIAKRLNLDFSLGVGYHWGIFHEYLPMDDCYVWQVTKKRNYIGPVKADISLVWQIGKHNINNRRKGGAR